MLLPSLTNSAAHHIQVCGFLFGVFSMHNVALFPISEPSFKLPLLSYSKTNKQTKHSPKNHPTKFRDQLDHRYFVLVPATTNLSCDGGHRSKSKGTGWTILLNGLEVTQCPTFTVLRFRCVLHLMIPWLLGARQQSRRTWHCLRMCNIKSTSFKTRRMGVRDLGKKIPRTRKNSGLLF